MNIIQEHINILLEHCVDFSGPARKYPDAGEIARKLVTMGSCLVAGDGLIWLETGRGSFGDFITHEELPEAVGCTLLKLDLEGFLRSAATTNRLESYEWELRNKIATLNKRLEAVKAIQELAHSYEAEADTSKHITVKNNADKN